jgi:hypothetical protein
MYSGESKAYEKNETADRFINMIQMICSTPRNEVLAKIMFDTITDGVVLRDFIKGMLWYANEIAKRLPEQLSDDELETLKRMYVDLKI